MDSFTKLDQQYELEQKLKFAERSVSKSKLMKRNHSKSFSLDRNLKIDHRNSSFLRRSIKEEHSNEMLESSQILEISVPETHKTKSMISENLPDSPPKSPRPSSTRPNSALEKFKTSLGISSKRTSTAVYDTQNLSHSQTPAKSNLLNSHETDLDQESILLDANVVKKGLFHSLISQKTSSHGRNQSQMALTDTVDDILKGGFKQHKRDFDDNVAFDFEDLSPEMEQIVHPQSSELSKVPNQMENLQIPSLEFIDPSTNPSSEKSSKPATIPHSLHSKISLNPSIMSSKLKTTIPVINTWNLSFYSHANFINFKKFHLENYQKLEETKAEKSNLAENLSSHPLDVPKSEVDSTSQNFEVISNFTAKMEGNLPSSPLISSRTQHSTQPAVVHTGLGNSNNAVAIGHGASSAGVVSNNNLSSTSSFPKISQLASKLKKSVVKQVSLTGNTGWFFEICGSEIFWVIYYSPAHVFFLKFLGIDNRENGMKYFTCEFGAGLLNCQNDFKSNKAILPKSSYGCLAKFRVENCTQTYDCAIGPQNFNEKHKRCSLKVMICQF